MTERRKKRGKADNSSSPFTQEKKRTTQHNTLSSSVLPAHGVDSLLAVDETLV
jgi:hypothetical protein